MSKKLSADLGLASARDFSAALLMIRNFSLELDWKFLIPMGDPLLMLIPPCPLYCAFMRLLRSPE